MKHNSFCKLSDKLLTFITWFMFIIFVPTVIITVLEYNCVMPHAPRPITNIAMALDTPVTWILTVVTILAQLMFIVSHMKLLKGNIGGIIGGILIITILTLNIILEVPVVVFLCKFDLQFIFYLWVPIVLFAAEFTKKKFFKAEER